MEKIDIINQIIKELGRFPIRIMFDNEVMCCQSVNGLIQYNTELMKLTVKRRRINQSFARSLSNHFYIRRLAQLSVKDNKKHIEFAVDKEELNEILELIKNTVI